MILALIDLDSIIFIVAYNNRDEDEILGKISIEGDVKSFIEEILIATDAEEAIGFYQGNNHKNYRNEIDPYYKSNRKGKPDFILRWREYILEVFDALFIQTIRLQYIESDDAISVIANEHKEEYDIVVAHIDKDLNMIPGKHYNYRTKKKYFITELEAESLYKRMVLTGDSTDGIPGIPGIGPKTADKYLQETNGELVQAFYKAAKKKKVKDIADLFKRTRGCIRMLKTHAETEKYKEPIIFKVEESDISDIW